MSARTVCGRTRNVRNRVRNPGVLRGGSIEVIRCHSVLLKTDVFEHRTELNGIVNLRFAVRIEVDGFGVTAAFHVEHAVFAPSVLVVTDQGPVHIARKRGLAGAGKTEENRCLPFIIDVGRAVHGKYVVHRRQHKIHHGEHALLDFARVGGTGNEDQLFRKTHGRYVCLSAPVNLRARLKRRGTNDGPFRRWHQYVFFIQPNEHVGNE